MSRRPEDVYQELYDWKNPLDPTTRVGLPTVRNIAERVGISETTTRRYLDELVVRGWVKKEKRRGAYGWRLVWHFFALDDHRWDEL